jgi:hypothetical protein
LRAFGGPRFPIDAIIFVTLEPTAIGVKILQLLKAGAVYSAIGTSRGHRDDEEDSSGGWNGGNVGAGGGATR